MSVFDPKNPQMSSINLGARVSKPLRSIMNNGSRLMSNNKFIKTMRGALTESGKMGDKLARKVSIRMAAGVKREQLGLDTVKHEKAVTEGMKQEGMLGVSFQKNPKSALKVYAAAAEALSQAEHKPDHVAGHSLHAANNENQELEQVDPKAAAEHRHETHDRMQKIRDDIERQKKEHQAHEVSASHSFGAETRQETTTSIAHATAHPVVGASVSGSRQNAIGSINARDNQAVSGSIDQILKQKAANENLEEDISFGQSIQVANDNVEDVSSAKKAA